MQRRILWLVSGIATVVFCGVWALVVMWRAAHHGTSPSPEMVAFYGGLGLMAASGIPCCASFIGILVTPKKSRLNGLFNAMMLHSVAAYGAGMMSLGVCMHSWFVVLVMAAIAAFIVLILSADARPHIWISALSVGAALLAEVLLYGLLPPLWEWLSMFAKGILVAARLFLF